MSQQKLLIKVIDTLDLSGIDYMITRSVASSLQGEPRSTHDIDVIVRLMYKVSLRFKIALTFRAFELK